MGAKNKKRRLRAKQIAEKMISPYDVLGSWTGTQAFDEFGEPDYPEQDVDDL